MKENIQSQIRESLKVIGSFTPELIKNIGICAKRLIKCINNGGKILICGNGGSAADSQHFAAELVSKFKLERRALPALALTTNTSIITAVGNDYEFKNIFSRQTEAFGQKNDILFAISTSGTSENILKAIKQAKKQNISSIGLTGKTGGKMKNLCDLILCVPSKDTPRIQESHILIIHIICDIVEKHFSQK